MKVEFELTGDDILVMFREVRGLPEQREAARREYHRVLSMGLLPIFIVVLVLLVGGADPGAYVALVVLPAVAVLAAWSLDYRLGRRAALKAAATLPGGVGLGHHTLVLDADGIAVATPHMSSRHLWLAVKGVEEGRDFVFVAVLPGGLIPVPKRAFGTAADEASFREFINERARGALAAG